MIKCWNDSIFDISGKNASLRLTLPVSLYFLKVATIKFKVIYVTVIIFLSDTAVPKEQTETLVYFNLNF